MKVILTALLVLFAISSQAATIDQILSSNLFSHDGIDPSNKVACNVTVKYPHPTGKNYFDILLRQPTQGDIYWYREEFPYPSRNDWSQDESKAKLTFVFSSDMRVELDYNPLTLKLKAYHLRPSGGYNSDCTLN